MSWFEESPAISLDLIHATGVKADVSIIDIGGGASRLVDALLDDGLKATVLDLSGEALERSKARLGARSAKAQWVVADVTKWEPSQTYDVWHDRATFQFLTDEKGRAAYAERVLRAVRPSGHVIIGTFALDGPERCSGLPILRHDTASLGRMLGPSFEPIESRNHAHQTPMGVIQRFQFSRFRRLRYQGSIPMNPNKALWEKGDFTRIAAEHARERRGACRDARHQEGLKVLDLGCGDGTTALPAAKLGADVLGVDIARNLVEAGNRRAQEQGLDEPPLPGRRRDRSARAAGQDVRSRRQHLRRDVRAEAVRCGQGDGAGDPARRPDRHGQLDSERSDPWSRRS